MQDCVICSQRYRLAWHRLSVSGGAGLVRHAPVFKKLLYETKIVMLEMFYCQWDHMAHISMFSPAASWIPVTSHLRQRIHRRRRLGCDPGHKNKIAYCYQDLFCYCCLLFIIRCIKNDRIYTNYSYITVVQGGG